MGVGESLLVGCEFFVLGVIGNVYFVKLEKIFFCICLDVVKGNVCKYLLFVMLCVFKLLELDLRVW